MAYVNFAEAQVFEAASQPEPARGETDTAPRGFTALEWSVIALARRDRVSSLREPGRIAKAMGNLFGTLKNPQLADARLEALRRVAVLAWHRSYVVPMSALREFKAVGFTIEQYETLQASISRGRPREGRRFA